MLGKFIKAGLNRCCPSKVLVRGGRHAGNTIALTFDDGPHPEHTLEILEILEQRSLKATFFLQGVEAERHPDLVRRIDQQGHQIANHGYIHCHTGEVNSKEYVAGILRAQQVLEGIAGRPVPRVFRPPYGATSLVTLWKLLKLGFQYVFWSVDSCDSFVQHPDELVDSFEKQPLRPGDILLFHEDYRLTVDALPRILDRLMAEKYNFVSVSELNAAIAG